MQYDAAGNLTYDGGQSFTYDATGAQVQAPYWGVWQGHDGDGLRVKNVENGGMTYYLHSTVLGGQVAAELDASGGWMRGYVYAGEQTIAVQAGGVLWTHQDPINKSQRVTDASGNVAETIELDPFGGETNRNSGGNLQPHRYTSWDRNITGDESLFRRYHGWFSRFAHPDPSDGSYEMSDPQSFNRYAYVKNDPVNFTDPSGLMANEFCGAEYSYVACGGNGGFWGGGSFGGHVAEYNREYGGLSPSLIDSVHTYNERVGNAVAGNGFKTSAELTREFEIRYGYNADGSLWTSFSISLDVGERGYTPFTFGGLLDQWPPQWPRGVDGYDSRFGWKTQPAPELEQFPEKIVYGPKGSEARPVFDPNKVPSNASRFSRLARGSLNALGKLLGGVGSVVGGTFVDIGGVMLGPSFLLNPCTRNPYDPRCRKPGPQL
jgi:RHS repeat-associated protein